MITLRADFQFSAYRLLWQRYMFISINNINISACVSRCLIHKFEYMYVYIPVLLVIIMLNVMIQKQQRPAHWWLNDTAATSDEDFCQPQQFEMADAVQEGARYCAERTAKNEVCCIVCLAKTHYIRNRLSAEQIYIHIYIQYMYTWYWINTL